MPSFQKDAFRTPFGRNNFLRSTRDVKTESYTFAAATLPAVTIDGSSQKVLQPGMALAKATSGASSGMVGPFQRGTGAAGTNEQQSVTLTGATGGTFTLSFESDTTAAIAFDATAATVQSALEALSTIGTGNALVTGSPGGPYTVEFRGALGQTNVPTMAADGAALTGTTPTAVVATTVPGTAPTYSGGATDGRGDVANIVGLNNTFLPWQLLDRDVEVAAVYECTAVQAWCYELDGSGLVVALTNTTADAMRGVKGMDIHFK